MTTRRWRILTQPNHTAIPGFVYGGLIAALIDCHGTGTATAAGYRAEGRALGSSPLLRYVTASLHVDYLHPTPHGPMLELRGRVKEVTGRKVVVEVWLVADGVTCAAKWSPSRCRRRCSPRVSRYASGACDR